jgi:hypothetical protein
MSERMVQKGSDELQFYLIALSAMSKNLFPSWHLKPEDVFGLLSYIYSIF